VHAEPNKTAYLLATHIALLIFAAIKYISYGSKYDQHADGSSRNAHFFLLFLSRQSKRKQQKRKSAQQLSPSITGI
jgi:hypothetical protein